MKKPTLQRATFILLTILLFISFSCEEKFLIANISTDDVTNITEATAICGGKIISNGGTNITLRGVCWDTLPNPTIDNQKVIITDSIYEFTTKLTDLIPGKNYFVRAFAINKGGVAYGANKTFTTNGISVSTTPPIEILSHSATSGGTIATEGTGNSILFRGVCYSTFSLPTKANDTITAGYGKGTFSVNLINLQRSTTYFVRAYATSKTGTYYGDLKQFVTNDGLAKLTTASATNITNTSAMVSGNIMIDGGSSIETRGFVWSTSQKPTISLSTKTSDGSGIGLFTSSITGLIAGETYYVRAYATNSDGTAYGNEISFTTDGMTDIDGNIYNTITIGTQVWTVENLKTTRYNNGDVIGTTTPASLNIKFENSPKYQWAPNGDESYVFIYGRLYTWYVVNDNRRICPKGWHVATHDDWMKLKDYVAINLSYSTSVGKALAAKEYWNNCYYPNSIGNDLTNNNSSGFTALPSGVRNFELGFNGFGSNCMFWSSDSDMQSLNECTSFPGLYGMTSTSNGLSVRCVKD